MKFNVVVEKKYLERFTYEVEAKTKKDALNLICDVNENDVSMNNKTDVKGVEVIDFDSTGLYDENILIKKIKKQDN